eukprot:TRINITY_DN20124_c0_g1_i6.p1 TRINITY_DN20124_c0_g1~~TRINITY_DN20124_c0_g1_i6.p1  ORF type:complete len:550 (+),score=99.92 TRINITY_DN20124_c0_g1_i6:465-2114(+)
MEFDVKSDVGVILALSSFSKKTDSEIEQLTQALGRLRILSRPTGNIQLIITQTRIIEGLLNLLENSHLTAKIHAEAAWIINTVFFHSTLLCNQATALGAVQVLAHLIMKHQSFRIQSQDQLHSLWALGNLVAQSPNIRDQMIDIGVLDYLGETYRLGNMCGEIKDSEYNGASTSNVLEDYSLFLGACCVEPPIPKQDSFLQNVVFVLCDILKKRHVNRLVMSRSLSAIAHCREANFSTLGWDVRQVLFEILKSEVEAPAKKKDEMLKKCFEAASAFSGSGDHDMDEEIGSLFVKTLCQNSVLELCEPVVVFLSNCKVTSSEELLRKVQCAYQKYARSPNRKSKEFALSIAQAASNNVDYFGFGNVIVPSFEAEEAFKYYLDHLLECVATEFQVTEVMQLICDLANESYFLHQHIDVQDIQVRQWCAAEIICMELPIRIRVHYTGWSDGYDEWIRIPSQRIAPAFTFTRQEMDDTPEETSNSLTYPGNLRSLLSSKVLGISTGEKVLELLAAFKNDMQSAINHARWVNRRNHMEIYGYSLFRPPKQIERA